MLVIGVLITAIFWYLLWERVPIISENAFFPLWLGYILTINGLCELLFKSSLIKSLHYHFVWLFFISIPFWWIFEFFNRFVQNWHYIIGRDVTYIEYLIRASIDFSTVIPAVLSASYLFYKLFYIFIKMKPNMFKVRVFHPVWLFISGTIMCFFVVYFPIYFFPFLWIALILIIDPVCYYLKFPSLLSLIEKGRILPILALCIATLFTGFWWEMWNYYSLPKWYYTIPFFEFGKVFEMPILGYLGYPFFGLELFSYTSLSVGLFFRKKLFNVFKEVFN